MRRPFLLVQVAVSLLLVGAIAWWASRQRRPTLPHGASGWGAVAVALCGYALATVLRGERWHLILGRSGIHPARRDTYALTTIGYAGNNVLPARAGEVLRVFLLSSRTQALKRQVLGTILAERVLDAAALGLVLVVVAFGLIRGGLPHGRALVLAAVAAALLAAAALATLAILRRRGSGERVRRLARQLLGATRDLVSAHGAALLALSLAIWIIEAGVYVAVARALAVHLGLAGALYIVGLANLFALIPAAPGYVGTFDAAVIFGLSAVGAARNGISYLLLLRFVLFVPVTLVGLGLLVARYGGFSRLAASRAAEEPV